jgi:hypothetical protein
MITMERFLKWRILPRGMMLAMTLMSYQVVQWFMDLGVSATTQQTAFVSTVIGAMTGAFAIWMGHEHQGDK